MDDKKYDLLGINTIINEKRLPFSLIYKDNMTHCSVQLNAWIKSRGLTESRKDLNEIKKFFFTVLLILKTGVNKGLSNKSIIKTPSCL